MQYQFKLLKMSKTLFCFLLLALLGCTTDYSEIEHPEFGVYYNKSINEKIVILDETNYIHIYNNGKDIDTSTYAFYPGIKEVNFWGQIRFANFHDINANFNIRRINNHDKLNIFSFAYSPESFYTGKPVIVSDIQEVRNGFNLQ